MVYVCDKSGEVYSHTLWTGGDYSYEWSGTYTSSDTDFVRAELCAERGADYEFAQIRSHINHPDYELGPMSASRLGGIAGFGMGRRGDAAAIPGREPGLG